LVNVPGRASLQIADPGDLFGSATKIKIGGRSFALQHLLF
jgi:hypothetical protein